jgi:hypothetical protein
VAVAVRGVAVVTWQCVYRPGWVIAVILSGDKFKIGWNGSGEGAAWGGGRGGPRDGVWEQHGRVAGWQWRCVEWQWLCGSVFIGLGGSLRSF